MANEEPIRLRIVAFQDGDMWVAQCLEYDIATQADSMDTLVARMDDTLCAEAEYTNEQHGEPFAGLDPAPDLFNVMFETATAALKSENDFRIAA